MGDIRPKTTSPKIGSNRCARFALVVKVVFVFVFVFVFDNVLWHCSDNPM